MQTGKQSVGEVRDALKDLQQAKELIESVVEALAAGLDTSPNTKLTRDACAVLQSLDQFDVSFRMHTGVDCE